MSESKKAIVKCDVCVEKAAQGYRIRDTGYDSCPGTVYIASLPRNMLNSFWPHQEVLSIEEAKKWVAEKTVNGCSFEPTLTFD